MLWDAQSKHVRQTAEAVVTDSGKQLQQYKFCQDPGQSCQPELAWGAAPNGLRSFQGAAAGGDPASSTDFKQPAKHKYKAATAESTEQPKPNDEPTAASRGRSIQGAAENGHPATATGVEQPAEHNDEPAATDDALHDAVKRPGHVLPCPAGDAGPGPLILPTLRTSSEKCAEL